MRKQEKIRPKLVSDQTLYCYAIQQGEAKIEKIGLKKAYIATLVCVARGFFAPILWL